MFFASQDDDEPERVQTDKKEPTRKTLPGF
jgi:hypothetical protein